ncbi:MAG: 2Fe-2S iron-sulfur cluster binding domain-containing protein, partial [Clostridia bacterium]|nr:2Fe-2S iron-sulfur cluster binding domain-containing protein [Clostridia bacterium]
MKNEYTTVLYDGKPIEVKCGEPLSLALRAEAPCGAHGNCGKCKAKVTGDISPLTEGERAHLTKEEIQNGIRLLCQVCAFGNAEVISLRAGEKLSVLTEGTGEIVVGAPLFQHYGIAIDIGT